MHDHNSLEALRKKLLNLTTRNNLISYKHPKSSSLRIVDELPNQIFEQLNSGKSFSFSPVPEPTKEELIEAGYLEYNKETQEYELVKEEPSAKEWAKHLGIATSYDLPVHSDHEAKLAAHQDNKLQTLHFSRSLEPILRNITSKTKIAMEEGGVNILYLNLGFLEWAEADHSEVKRLAPLFTIPVRIEKTGIISKEGAFIYEIRMKEDGLLTNVSLKEKLKNDFGLALPEISDDLLPENYFELLSNSILKSKPKWRIRRQASLAILNFSKQLMYEDLNPENWPKHQKLMDHPIISRLFGKSGFQDSDANISDNFIEEYQIDKIEDVHIEFPLVFDADSSQHSAIIDAVKGENLVIEGPPGSGKSQTIANMIAANMANGKKVLFVAEKMAALNVVKQRLDKVGLGELCLELHSHKTQKQKILGELKQGLASRGNPKRPEELDISIQRYENFKQKLNDYADQINQEWKQTGLTVHQILNKAVKLRAKYNINPNETKIEDIEGSNFTLLKQKEFDDNAKNLVDIYRQAAEQAFEKKIHNHYWHGVNITNITSYEEDALIQKLISWNESLRDTKEHWQANQEHLNLPSLDEIEIDHFDFIHEVVCSLPELEGQELLSLLVELSENKNDLDDLISLYQEVHDNYDVILEKFDVKILNHPTLKETKLACYEITKMGTNLSNTIEQIHGYSEQIRNNLIKLEELKSQFSEILEYLPRNLQNIFKLDVNHLNEVRTLFSSIDSLPSQYWQYKSEAYDKQHIFEPLTELLTKVKVLQEIHPIVEKDFSVTNEVSIDELIKHQVYLSKGGLFKWAKSDWRASRSVISGLKSHKQVKFTELEKNLQKLIDYKIQQSEIEQHLAENPDLFDFYDGVKTNVNQISTLLNWYNKVRNEYGWGFGKRVKIANSLLQLDGNLAQNLIDFYRKNLEKPINELLSYYDQIQLQFPNSFNEHSKNDNLISKLENIKNQLSKSLNSITSNLKDSKLSLKSLNTYIDRTEKLLLTKENWSNFGQIRNIIEPEFSLSIEANHFSENHLNSLYQTQSLVYSLSNIDLLIKSISKTPTEENYIRLQKFIKDLHCKIHHSNNLRKLFYEEGEVKNAEWLGDHFKTHTKIIDRNQRAIDNISWLQTWLDYIGTRNRLSETGLAEILNLLEQKIIKPSELLDVINLICFDKLAKEIFDQKPDLRNFSGSEQMANRKRFAEYDLKIRELQAQWVKFSASLSPIPAGNSVGRVGDYTQGSLVSHHASKKRPRIAVRALLNGADQAIQSLKPCFMMSPMSVAQYLTPGNFDFDVVVMDEASQIRPEDALGALARGKKAIIVGDPKQLPPTSFFEKTIEDDVDEDDQIALENSDSILESVLPIFKTRRLRWHYRSRHESLIEFSNHQFYDSNLIIFPSPDAESTELGVKYHRIKKGHLKNSRNVIEAKAIVKKASQLLLDQYQNLKNLSKKDADLDDSVNTIGIVAMNSQQQDEIARQFEQAEKDNDLVREAKAMLEKHGEPVFVKNLENVQGDERDVILISMTYGPETIGASTMYQRFGPISQDVGWRRLNVLFTRSKKQMHIFSSMDSGHIRTSEKSSKGVLSLREFLNFCETGQITSHKHTSKSADSDFEIAVMEALEKHGYECEPQLGVAGYFLDLVVRDPGQPGRFLMAIECDGATYHSAKSARDRDRLRQSNLENLGWRVRRIWSTDWFKHPEAQLKPILQELEALKTPILETEEIDETLAEIMVEADELDEIDTIVIEQASEELTDTSTTEQEISLYERLNLFNQNIIRKEAGEVDLMRQLLRPALLEVLCNHVPATRSEFLEVVPTYMRDNIDHKDAIYLDRVLEIIEQYG